MQELFQFDNNELQQVKDSLTRQQNILSKYATKDEQAVRKYQPINSIPQFRTEFGIDVDKILHNTMYNRYTDKTQVFSFYKNDDITRRSLHVQLVSRIAKIIGAALGLNLDLIEAISLGHDIGHTPFGHKGEYFLNELYLENTGRYFNHNVHSIRVLKHITRSNLTLQTYDGILCHCGEKAFEEYRPISKYQNFNDFELLLERCYTEKDFIKNLRPSTLEGCVVRISDMIAYVGKDRQDAIKARLATSDYTDSFLGKNNSEIISNLIINIIKNSIGKDFIRMDTHVYQELERLKNDNQKLIYENPIINTPYYETIQPMMQKIYYDLKRDVIKHNWSSPIFQHHLNHTIIGNCYRDSQFRSIVAKPDDIVTDYIASMTDDYFIDLFRYMYPEDTLNGAINYISYFD